MAASQIRPTLSTSSQAGDAEAFGELYDRYIERIYVFIYRKVGNHAVAEDLTADTFFKALRNIGRLERQRDTPLNWLNTIARNTVTDHLRSARVRLVHSPEALPDLVDPEPDPDQQVALDCDAIMIRGLIRRLNPPPPRDHRRRRTRRLTGGYGRVARLRGWRRTRPRGCAATPGPARRRRPAGTPGTGRA